MVTYLLFLSILLPVDSLNLDREYANISTYGDRIYCAPFNSKSLTVIAKKQKYERIVLTDGLSYQIYDLLATPFALYMNRGTSIEKLYLSSGIKEQLYTAHDIITFTLLAAEEIVLADRYDKTLVFLDPDHNEKFTITDIVIQDIAHMGSLIYALTATEMLLIDEHGNILERIDKPPACNNLIAADSCIISYRNGDKAIFLFKDSWIQIQLSHTILDITSDDEFILMLKGDGRVLYSYRKSDF